MFEKSYGIIPFHREENVLMVFLIHQYGSGGDMLWTFPKGRGEDEESPIQTALRELKEETALNLVSYNEKNPLSLTYSFVRHGEEITKTTTYFIGFVRATDFHIQETEVKEAGWFDLKEARERITFPDQKALLDEAVRLLDK